MSVTGVGGLSLTPTPNYTNNVNVGTATASYTFSGDANHDGSSDSKNFEITKASTTTTVTCPASETYTGAAITPCTVAVTGANLSLTPTPNYANNTNVGTATASYTYASDANHDGSTGNSSFAIGKASSTTTVNCPTNVTYTSSALEPCTASVTGVGGLNESLTVNYTNNTNAGTANASASYAGDANHTGSSDSKNFTIDPAASTTTVTCGAGPFSYDGSAKTPCTASVTGAGGLNQSLTVNYTNNTSAGTATASASYAGDVNHAGSSDSKNFEITKASSTVTVTCPGTSQTYNGSPQAPCTAEATGVGMSPVNVSASLVYSNNTNVGTATADASWAGDADHTGNTGSSSFTISQATSTVTVTCTTGTPHAYMGSAQTPCTAAATGAGMSAVDVTSSLVYGNNINVGAATAGGSWAGDTNHTGNTGSGGFSITLANQTITWSNPAAIIYGTALSVTQLNAAVAGVPGGSAPGGLTYSPVSGTILSAGPHTLSVDAAATSNYNAAHKDVTINVNKAPLSITADNKSMLFGGSVPAFTVAYSGFVAGENASNLGGTLTFTVKDSLNNPVTVSASTLAGTYTIIPGGLTSSNYNISFVNGTLTIGSWTLHGFYQPVDMSISAIIWNTIKGGSTVPLKFNIFAGSVERTSTSDIASFIYAVIPCITTGVDDPVDTSLLSTGGTVLRYSGTPGSDGQFIQNWQTPKPANVCYQVRMTALDGSHLDAFFKTK